jgi:hypothetical protein
MTIKLENGAKVKVKNKRIAFGQVSFVLTITHANGYCIENINESYPIGYFNSVEEFVKSKY